MPEDSLRERTLREIEQGKLRINFRETSIPGVFAAEATLPAWPAPVGTVWIRHHGNTTVDIVQSYVAEDIRRCGIRTAIQKTITEWWPETTHIKTAQGTAEGEAWMKAVGYKKQPNGDWVYKVPKRKTRK